MIARLPNYLEFYLANFLTVSNIFSIIVCSKKTNKLYHKFILKNFVRELNCSSILKRYEFIKCLPEINFIRSNFYVVKNLDVAYPDRRQSNAAYQISTENELFKNRNKIYFTTLPPETFLIKIPINCKISYYFYDYLGCLLRDDSRVENLISIIHINFIKNSIVEQIVIRYNELRFSQRNILDCKEYNLVIECEQCGGLPVYDLCKIQNTTIS